MSEREAYALLLCVLAIAVLCVVYVTHNVPDADFGGWITNE
jgi:hypothetical protein